MIAILSERLAKVNRVNAMGRTHTFHKSHGQSRWALMDAADFIHEAKRQAERDYGFGKMCEECARGSEADPEGGM